MNKYQQRLLSEWQIHGKIIIATDYDGTISYWNNLENQEDIEKVIKTLKLCQEVGCYLTIFTACNKDRFPEIKQHCQELGLNIDSINQNPIQLPYGNESKIYANVFVDDRSLTMLETVEKLEEVAYMMRSFKNSQINLDEIG